MKIKNLLLPGITLILAAAFIGTAIARDLTSDQKGVVCRLRNEVQQRRGNGYKLVFWPLIGKVRKQAESPFRATLYPGTEYIFVGACDENCQGLNLALKDVNSQVVAASEKTEALPVLAFTPSVEGEYQVAAKPGECTTPNGCSFGMGIFAPVAANIPNASRLPEELAQFQFCQ